MSNSSKQDVWAHFIAIVIILLLLYVSFKIKSCYDIWLIDKAVERIKQEHLHKR